MTQNPYAAPTTPSQVARPVIDSLNLLLLRIDLFVSASFALRAAIISFVLSSTLFGEGSETLGVELRVLLIGDFTMSLLDLLAGFLFLGYDLRSLISRRRSIALLIVAHVVLFLFLGLRYYDLYSDLFGPFSEMQRQRLFSIWLPCIARLMYWPVCLMGYGTMQKVWSRTNLP
ncbi:MAG: hypothetical protein JNM27_05195 [Leptospirales bacterium]|nr:hypothetical protein [Leptospirales bacterium]